MGEGKTLPTYFCRNCENPLALGEDLISKKFVVTAKYEDCLTRIFIFHFLSNFFNMVKMDIGSFRTSVYVFSCDERGDWTED